ncbi:MAG TPA: class I SAM-dependent methyltransferase [Pyrinomonadaceae bacterium]|nr:class I SAM-dependent methyltransferase [Pyrinomonadaceae bacterium]
MNNLPYRGSELELFEKAKNWKAYYQSLIKDYLGREVLEVGAGIGATTKVLCSRRQTRWVCLEPDHELGNKLRSLIDKDQLPSTCEVRLGLVSELGPEELFDTVIYIDVLEHIENDQEELQSACDHLKPGGFLVVLSPAHQSLYTPFDEAIGHHRRYNKQTLLAVVPEELELTELKYLDSVGATASLGNRFVLKQKSPSVKQLAVWDKLMVPLSRLVDPLLGYRAGKSVLGVWRKSEPPA